MKRAIAAFVSALVAISAALLSVGIERTGPEVGSYGNLCGPSHNEDCLEPLLKGGFPVAFLFDMPGVSVEHQLSFGEDNFYLAAFTCDVAFYFIFVLCLLVAVQHASKRRGYHGYKLFGGELRLARQIRVCGAAA